MLQLSCIKQLTNAVPFRSGCWNPDSIVHLCKIIGGYPKPTPWFEVYERKHGTWRKLLCVMRKGLHPAIHSLGIEDQTIVLIIFWHCKQTNSFIPVNFIQPPLESHLHARPKSSCLEQCTLPRGCSGHM